MSSLYKKEGVFYYQSYYTDGKGNPQRIQKSLRTKEEYEALMLQRKWDTYYEQRETEDGVVSPFLSNAYEMYMAERKVLLEAEEISEHTYRGDKYAIPRLRKFITQAEAAEALGVSRPRISEIKNGHLDKFSTDLLLVYCHRAGLRVPNFDLVPAG